MPACAESAPWPGRSGATRALAVFARCLLPVLVAIAVAGCTANAPSATPEGGASPTATPNAVATPEREPFAAAPVPPPTSTPIAEDWGLPNGGLGNARSSSAPISSENIASLEVTWSRAIGGSGPYGAAAGGVVIAEGTVYVQDLASTLVAYDLATGDVLWRQPGLAATAGPNGPVVADGRVYASRGGNEVGAFDAVSGAVLWSMPLEKEGLQPFVLGEVVFVGTGAFAHVGGKSGFLHAFDAETGEPRWEFQVVEDGFWGDPSLNSGGGVWYPGAIDEARSLVYIGTGNAGPSPGTREFPNGSSRPGNNLYTSSLAALDVATGEVVWYYQAVAHGLFDHDFQLPPLLTSIVVQGAERDIVIGAGKVGRVVALDRGDGEVLWETAVGVHQNDDLTALPPGEAVAVLPGIFGGVETPMALANGRVFVPVVNLATLHRADGHGALDGSSALLAANANTRLGDGRSELVSLDVTTGEILWSTPFDSPLFGGATAVGDLVFTATFDGTIVALRQSDGVEVWRFEAGGGINAWPAIAGDTLVWAIGLGANPRVIAWRLPAAPVGEP